MTRVVDLDARRRLLVLTIEPPRPSRSFALVLATLACAGVSLTLSAIEWVLR